MKISIIDVGSNSVRLATLADGKTLYKRLETTRLGEGLSFSGKMSNDAIERSARAVSGFKAQAEQDGAEKVFVFATAAVRSAANSTQFLSRVKELCGLDVDVISGEQEARVGLLGALKGGDGGIIDVGGASTEVTVQQNGQILYSKSVNIGAVRLFDMAGRSKDKLNAVIEQSIKDYGKFNADNHKICAIGGTATTLASVKHCLKVYNPAITDGTIIKCNEVLETADRLLSLSVEQVRALDGMDPRRADVIGGGCLLLGKVMQKFNIGQITVSESDNIEGYYLLKERGL